MPIFRYADILLTKAEALLRGGVSTVRPQDTAVSLFNEIRRYVHADEVTNVTLDELYDERGREFFDENWRRNDMIRFGHFEDEFSHITKTSQLLDLKRPAVFSQSILIC